MNKKIPLWLVLLLLWFSLLITLWFGWLVWKTENRRYRAASKTERFIMKAAAFPTLVKRSFEELNQKSILIRPDRFPDINGLVTENKYIDSNYILLSTYDKNKNQSIAKLIRLSDQKVMYQWTPDYAELVKLLAKQNRYWPERNVHNMRLYHPLLSADGTIIFNSVLSPLIKIDKDSKLVWSVNGQFHHSVEFDAERNIWAPSAIKPSVFLPGFLDEYIDCAITEISPEGKLLYQKSVAQLLDENGYRPLVMGVGDYEQDMLHLNDIKPALTSGKYWMKGDLLISIRNRSTVFLFRPTTNKVVWLQTGPWLCQHDANFIGSDKISVFGNDVLRDFGRDRLINGYNNEYVINFSTHKTETPYTEFFKKAHIATPTEGRSELLPNGDLFIEETNNDRLLRGNAKGVVWQYVDRIDQHSVAALSWSRFITKDEFKKFTFLKTN